MPITVNQITDKQFQEVLSYIEGHFLDLKAKEVKPSKLPRQSPPSLTPTGVSFISVLLRT
jgi:hypothetical protein